MRGLLTGAGRVLLHVFVIVLLFVGMVHVIRAFAASPDKQPRRIIQHRTQPAWPDDTARGVAVAFARDYWTRDPAHPDAYEKQLRKDVTDDLAGMVTPSWPAKRRLSAGLVTVAGGRPVDKNTAVVTVSADVTVNKGLPSRVYLDVTVTRHGTDLIVSALPAVVAGPARAPASQMEVTPLPPDESVEVTAMLGRFFRAYLEGDTPGLEFFTLPGVKLHASRTPLTYGEVTQTGTTTPPHGRTRLLLVDVTARMGSAVLPLQYRVRLQRGDRWYVAAINPGGTP